MSIALAFALVATAALASPTSEGEAAAAPTEQEMVRDPSTGEMINAPQYGGTLVYAWQRENVHFDSWWGSQYTERGTVLEKTRHGGLGNTQGRMAL